MESLKLPLSSVNVPVVVPLIVTETAETVSFDLLFLTLPDTVVDCCALTVIVKMAARSSKPDRRNLLIIANFGLEYSAK